MAMKSLIIIFVVVVVLMATQQAQAQSTVGLGLRANVSGVVSCSVNATLNSTTPIPPFPNATVQLVCGGNVVASAQTNATGAFNILVNPLQVIDDIISGSCRIVVATPLSACNATLPSTGRLVTQTLQYVGSTITGLLNLLHFIAGDFSLINQ